MGNSVPALGAVIGICWLCLDKCSSREAVDSPEVCMYQEASKKENLTSPEESGHACLEVETHICYAASIRNSRSGHTVAWEQALPEARENKGCLATICCDIHFVELVLLVPIRISSSEQNYTSSCSNWALIFLHRQRKCWIAYSARRSCLLQAHIGSDHRSL